MPRTFRSDPHWPVRLILGAACAAAVVASPGVARADSLLYAKGGQLWIAHADGSAARQVTSSANGWDSVYHLDQSGNQIGPYVETPGSRSTPACPTYSPWNLRVSPNGKRVSFNEFFCDNGDSFYDDLSTGKFTLISENYSASNWL